MDKKTIIAVALSVVIIIISMVAQNYFFPPPKVIPAGEQLGSTTQSSEPQATEGSKASTLAGAGELAEALDKATPEGPVTEVVPSDAVAAEESREETYILDTNVFRVTFTNRGGEIESILLKDFKNSDGTPVEMVLSGDSGSYPFSINYADFEGAPIDALFKAVPSLTGDKVEFYRNFVSSSGIPFTLRKTYIFKPNDYLIELRISIENSVNEYPDLNFDGLAYTLGFGPQIGPEFKKLDRRHEFRDYSYYVDGKKKKLKIPKEGFLQLENRVNWIAIEGKYFTAIAVPDATQYRITFDTRPINGVEERSSFYFGRPEIKSSKNIDVFRFYIGPKKRDILLEYNDPKKNGFGMQDMHFEEVVSSSIMLGWLANILKFFLEFFYKLIPNYGVAIILLTILIKIIFFPLTHKSFESTAKMASLNPIITEIKEKYKSNPQKMNAEVAALYKREGVNPLGGCLPMLLQMPIFFALYRLLSTHFALRGASFIQPWITDLSAPESVWDFSPFAIPIVGWHDLRILPFIMLVTTFIQSKLTQTGDASNKNMKMMAYMMPIMFFFILYDMPSGLVLYWTMQNFLSVFQQLYINKKRKRDLDKGGTSSAKDKKPKRGK